MLERAIIADDLTGALDAAAPFAMRNIPTAVALDINSLKAAIASGATVAGVSTDSREIEPDAARRAVSTVLAQLPHPTPVFKKVDSRLKGNIAAELDAIPYNRSLVIPAIPDFGRWMRDGRLGGFGVDTPIDIAQRLGAHASRATIPNIENRADIEAALQHDADLHIGARALAEAMAQAMARQTTRAPINLPHGPIYCVIGSTDPITLQQVEALRSATSTIAFIPAPNGTGPSLLPPPEDLTLLQAIPGPQSASGMEVAQALGDTLARIAPPPGSVLILSGGATAQAILRQMNIGVLQVLGEAEPGVPVATANGLTIITKSGGFGDPQTLVRLTSRTQSKRMSHVG